MKISESMHGAVMVLKPEGALLHEDVAEFDRRLREAIDARMGRVVLDASLISYVDSAGLEALVNAAERFSETGSSLRLCAESETLREVLNLTELGGMFEHHEDIGVAVRSFL